MSHNFITNLDHLGLIAGIIDDLDIENIVNSLIETEMTHLSRMVRVGNDAQGNRQWVRVFLIIY